MSPLVGLFKLLLCLCFFREGNASCTSLPSDIEREPSEPLSGLVYTFGSANGTTISFSPDPNFVFIPGNRSLYTTQVLNYTAVPHVLNFACSGTDAKSILLTINILDVNNVPPTWKLGGTIVDTSTVKIREGPSSIGTQLPPATDVQRPTCDGNDQPSVTSVSLQLMNGTNSDKFKLKSPPGNVLEVMVTSELDFEKTPSITLKIRCFDRDKATNKLTGTTDFVLVIEVENVIEKGSYTFDHSAYTAELRANTSATTVVKISPAPINATNREAELVVYPTYSIKFIDPLIQDYFSINNSTGEVTLIKTNPTPRTSPYKITLEVGMVGDSSATTKSTASLDVSILPAIDVPPHFSGDSLKPVAIPETLLPGPSSFPFRTVTAAYSEIAGYVPPVRNISFSVLTYKNVFGFFGCSKSSCSLRIIRKLDYENKDRSFAVNLSIYDGITTPVVGTLIVNVTDENDSTPTFEKEKYVFRDIPRDANQKIGSVKAIDADVNTRIVYSINDTKNFRIDSVGNITFRTDPLKLTEISYSFTVKATDGKNFGVTVVSVFLSGSIAASANTMLIAIAALGGAVVLILIVGTVGCCYFRRSAKARRGDQLGPNPQQNASYIYGMTTVQENPICMEIYGEEDGLDNDMYRSDRAVGEMQLNDTGGAAPSSVGGSIRTTMSSSNSFFANSQSHLVPNGNSIKLSTNSMELVAADNAVNSGPIEQYRQQEGKDHLTIYY